MKKCIFLLSFVFIVLFSCDDSSEKLDFNSNLTLDVQDYFEGEIPFDSLFYVTKPNHDEIASLGRLLFYDTRLSQNNSISCASCHQQNKGFSDDQRFSSGLKNYTTKRNSLSLVNNAYHASHFWEGHRGGLEDHILDPISNHIEMGMRSIDDLVVKLSSIEGYENLFEQVFEKEISEPLIKESLATFVASIISYNTKFDKGQSIDFANFSLAEKQGMELFFGKAKCGNCHKGGHYTASWRQSANIGLELDYEDEGAGEGKFKIPSLRNIALTSPYMHDGRFETLEDVLDHYVDGVKDHPSLDWALQSKIELTDIEKEQLVSFLHTLTDYELTTAQKHSNPF